MKGRTQMNDIAIVYISKCGHTKQYAEWLKDELNCDLYVGDKIDFSRLLSYKLIVFASGVYNDKIQIMDIIKKNISAINVQRTAVMVSTWYANDSLTAKNMLIDGNYPDAFKNRVPLYVLNSGIDKKKISAVDNVKLLAAQLSIEKHEDRSSDDINSLAIIKGYSDQTSKENLDFVVAGIKELMNPPKKKEFPAPKPIEAPSPVITALKDTYPVSKPDPFVRPVQKQNTTSPKKVLDFSDLDSFTVPSLSKPVTSEPAIVNKGFDEIISANMDDSYYINEEEGKAENTVEQSYIVEPILNKDNYNEKIEDLPLVVTEENEDEYVYSPTDFDMSSEDEYAPYDTVSTIVDVAEPVEVTSEVIEVTPVAEQVNEMLSPVINTDTYNDNSVTHVVSNDSHNDKPVDDYLNIYKKDLNKSTEDTNKAPTFSSSVSSISFKIDTNDKPSFRTPIFAENESTDSIVSVHNTASIQEETVKKSIFPELKKPPVKPAENAVVNSAENPFKKPAETPTEKPIEQSLEKHIESKEEVKAETIQSIQDSFAQLKAEFDISSSIHNNKYTGDDVTNSVSSSVQPNVSNFKSNASSQSKFAFEMEEQDNFTSEDLMPKLSPLPAKSKMGNDESIPLSFSRKVLDPDHQPSKLSFDTKKEQPVPYEQPQQPATPAYEKPKFYDFSKLKSELDESIKEQQKEQARSKEPQRRGITQPDDADLFFTKRRNTAAGGPGSMPEIKFSSVRK